jgi:hypothetical protein
MTYFYTLSQWLAKMEGGNKATSKRITSTVRINDLRGSQWLYTEYFWITNIITRDEVGFFGTVSDGDYARTGVDLRETCQTLGDELEIRLGGFFKTNARCISCCLGFVTNDYVCIG